MMRWISLGLAGMILLLALPAAVIARVDPGVAVPMYRGNPARTGEMPGPGPDFSREIGVRWRFATDGLIYSSPAVVDGVVYVGSRNGNIYALDEVSGAERWRFPTGDAVVSSPAVEAGYVYAGSDDGNLYAINATSGREWWRFATGDGVFSSPAVVEGVVYIGGEDGIVYALDAVTGLERWRRDLRGVILSSPAVVDGILYIGSINLDFSGRMVALDAATGYVLWIFGSAAIASTPAVAEGAVLVTAGDGTIYAINATSGRERWRFSATGEIWQAPAVSAGIAFIAIGGDEGNGTSSSLLALDIDTGRQRWRIDIPGAEEFSPPAVVDGTVYVTTSDGTVVVLNGETGIVQWRFEIEGKDISSPPVVVGGCVFAGAARIEDDAYVDSELDAICAIDPA